MTATGRPRPRPRVVALGGGHGLAASLQAVRRYAATVTAIVSVADDGGSSGRLREAFGIPAPGDLRKCLVALGDPELLWSRAFEHRFDAGELQGHALGNLVIAGLTSATGSFTTALDEAGRLVGARGRVLPATVGPVVLKAEVEHGHVEGQVAVANTERIRGVSIVPVDAEPPPDALAALAEADQIVLGPGSLFTSVLAVLAVPAIREALRAAAATTAPTARRRPRIVYVCNLRPQVPETAGFDLADHLDALAAHGVVPDVALFDPLTMGRGLPKVPVVAADLSAPGGTGHDPAKLAASLADLVG